MKLMRVIALAGTVLTVACGRVVDLQPAPGHPLPVRPLMARTTPTPNQLLTIPTYAKPDRVDELVKRSEPRPQDPFNLPPPTGGAAPSLPPASETTPNDQQSGEQPAPGMPVAPPPPGD
ncbi:MAG TPA: hypothetical protein VGM04_04080 [Sphingomicrobium sp.]|jgi:hypothetical protein